MIYVLRHQEGERYSNCLSRQGIERTKHIANVLTRSFENIPFKSVHTCVPVGYGHVRPIQTASNLCTFLQGRFSVLAHKSVDELVRDVCKIHEMHDTVIVWHHSEISELVQALCECFSIRGISFQWDEANFDGCVIMDTNIHKVVYEPNYFTKKFIFCYPFNYFQ